MVQDKVIIEIDGRKATMKELEAYMIGGTPTPVCTPCCTPVKRGRGRPKKVQIPKVVIPKIVVEIDGKVATPEEVKAYMEGKPKAETPKVEAKKVVFNVGDMVKCIDGCTSGDPYPPVKGEVYQITAVSGDGVDVSIRKRTGEESKGWYSDRFELTKDCKKDEFKVCKKRGRKPTQYVKINLSSSPYYGKTYKVLEIGKYATKFEDKVDSYCIIDSLYCEIVPKPETPVKEYRYRVYYTKIVSVMAKNTRIARDKARMKLQTEGYHRIVKAEKVVE